MHTTNQKKRNPYRFVGSLLFVIAVVALLDVFMTTSKCSSCGCTLHSRIKSLVTRSGKKYSKSINPIFVSPTTTGSKPATEDDQDSTFDEKIPLFLDYPTPVVPYKSALESKHQAN